MKVLSTARRSPWRRATAATAAMSVSFRVGFEGVSHHRSFVCGVMAASICAGSVMSTKENVCAICGPHTFRKYRCVPPSSKWVESGAWALEIPTRGWRRGIVRTDVVATDNMGAMAEKVRARGDGCHA
jgi:hypothetical protein